MFRFLFGKSAQPEALDAHQALVEGSWAEFGAVYAAIAPRPRHVSAVHFAHAVAHTIAHLQHLENHHNHVLHQLDNRGMLRSYIDARVRLRAMQLMRSA